MEYNMADFLLKNGFLSFDDARSLCENNNNIISATGISTKEAREAFDRLTTVLNDNFKTIKNNKNRRRVKMIKIENYEVMGLEHAIRGMRNPMNSWDKSDSGIMGNPFSDEECLDHFVIGPNDINLMMKLRNAGTDHRKFMRMITVYVDITAPLYWWKEFNTYKVGTVANSCSTMHKIHEKEFTLEDFSCEHLMTEEAFAFPHGGGWRGLDALEVLKCNIEALNNARKRYLATKDKKYWWQMIQLLPTSYNQKRTVMLNYEVLANIYKSRKNHKLDEWRDLCKWIESLPYSEIITGGVDNG